MLKDRIAFLKMMNLFEEAPESLLMQISERMQEIEVKAGTTIFREGDFGDAVYLIAHGTLGIVKDGVQFATLSSGECVGELALLDEQPRSVSVVAQTDALLLKLEHMDFQKIVSQSWEIAHGFLKILSERVRQGVQIQVESFRELEQAYGELVELNARMGTLYDISHEIDKVRDIQKILQVALLIMRGAVGSISGIALFWDLESGQPYVVSTGIQAEAMVENIRQNLTRQYFEWMHEEPEIVLLSPKLLRKIKIVEVLLPLSMETWIPLDVKDEMVGGIGLGKKLTNKPFSEEDYNILNAIAQNVAVALKNVILHSELLQLAEYNKAVIENMGNGLLVLKSSGELLTVNNRAEQLLQISATTVIGKDYREVLAMHDNLAALVGYALNTGESFTNCEMKIQSDSDILAEITISFLQGEDELKREMIVILNDVTQLREMQARMLLQERLASIGQFASQAAHDIKNALQGIRGFAEHILYDLETDTTACCEYIDTILQECDALHERTDRITDYAKVLQLDVHAVDVNKVMQSALNLVLPEIEKQQISVEVALHPTPLLVQLDHRYMKDALLNLMLNAVQAMASGGVLTLVTRPQGEKVELIVRDTGKGIPDAMKPKIFTPFFTTKRDIGTGLGLASVHKIVLAHNGQITFESQVGKGTEFVIRFPKV